MFDTIAGLPIHALVVHAVVVLLPLAGLAPAAVAVRPAWRRAALPMAVVDGLMFVATFVAKESGEKLQARLGGQIARDHGEQGNLLPYFALVLFVAAVIVWFARRHVALASLAAVLAVVAGAGVIGWTVVVGHSGATAVWSEVVKSTNG